MAEEKEKERKEERQAPRRGANFADVLIEMGNDLERWFKGLGPWAAVVLFFAYREFRQLARNTAQAVGRGAVLGWKFSREEGGPASRFFRGWPRQRARQFLRSQIQGLRRDREARARWNKIPLVVRMFIPRF